MMWSWDWIAVQMIISPKPFRMMELISRIKARLRRAEDKGAEEYHLENLYLCPGRHIVTVDQEPVNLTSEGV